jgi:hypothetical protein
MGGHGFAGRVSVWSAGRCPASAPGTVRQDAQTVIELSLGVLLWAVRAWRPVEVDEMADEADPGLADEGA